jgi:hypothetical protein
MESDAEIARAEAEFDACTGQLGIEVPPDLKGGVLRGYRGLRAMAELLPAAGTTEGEEARG